MTTATTRSIPLPRHVLRADQLRYQQWPPRPRVYPIDGQTARFRILHACGHGQWRRTHYYGHDHPNQRKAVAQWASLPCTWCLPHLQSDRDQ